MRLTHHSIKMARALELEPRTTVLETVMLPITPDSHVAEGVGFEPTEDCSSPPFQGGTFAHSVIPL